MHNFLFKLILFVDNLQEVDDKLTLIFSPNLFIYYVFRVFFTEPDNKTKSWWPSKMIPRPTWKNDKRSSRYNFHVLIEN